MHPSPLATEFRPITQDELENLPYLSLYVFIFMMKKASCTASG